MLIIDCKSNVLGTVCAIKEIIGGYRFKTILRVLVDYQFVNKNKNKHFKHVRDWENEASGGKTHLQILTFQHTFIEV